MKFSYLFVIALLTIALSSIGFAQTGGDTERTTTGIVFTVQGLANISVGNLYGGIGLHHYFSETISGRFSVGGVVTEEANSWNLSGTLMHDLMSVGDEGALYIGGGVVYSKPMEDESTYGILFPIGARINLLSGMTLGFEYVNTLALDPTVFTFGSTSGANGHLTLWF